MDYGQNLRKSQIKAKTFTFRWFIEYPASPFKRSGLYRTMAKYEIYTILWKCMTRFPLLYFQNIQILLPYALESSKLPNSTIFNLRLKSARFSAHSLMYRETASLFEKAYYTKPDAYMIWLNCLIIISWVGLWVLIVDCAQCTLVFGRP